jgi:hypothetical protein
LTRIADVVEIVFVGKGDRNGKSGTPDNPKLDEFGKVLKPKLEAEGRMLIEVRASSVLVRLSGG